MINKYYQNKVHYMRHYYPPDIKTSWRRRNDLSVRSNDVVGTSQMKQPTTSQWSVAKASQWYVSLTSY